ncbi:MAG: hypothetical protein ACN6O3_22055 [Comamonas sp.]
MQRCSPHRSLRRLALATLSAALLAPFATWAQAQTYAGFNGPVRNFPAAALRGTLVVASLSEATVDGKAMLLAPAFKLYTPQNTLARPNTVIGQPLKVNYVIEKATGRLHAAWVLNPAEAQQKRDSADNGFFSGLLK